MDTTFAEGPRRLEEKVQNRATLNCLMCHDDSGPIKNGGTHFMNQLEFFEKNRFFVFLKNDELRPP